MPLFDPYELGLAIPVSKTAESPIASKEALFRLRKALRDSSWQQPFGSSIQVEDLLRLNSNDLNKAIELIEHYKHAGDIGANLYRFAKSFSLALTLDEDRCSHSLTLERLSLAKALFRLVRTYKD